MQYVILLIELVLVAAMLYGIWKTLEKAGRPGMDGLIPIYNIYLLTKITGRPAWWTIIGLIPIVNILFGFDVARSFGKSQGFGIGLGLLPFVFYPMLAMGPDKYIGPAAAGQTGIGLPTGNAPAKA